jgi:D-alanyl-D-alanine carboxypeptidase
MWNALDLIRYTMAVSSNDGARALSRTSSQTPDLGDQEALNSFIKNTNIELTKLGYKTIHINNESGLDKNGENGGYASAYELAKFLTRSYTENPEIYDATYESRPIVSKDETQKRVKGTNETANKTLGLLASKTGFTDIASGNLAVIVDISLGHPVAIVVLGSSRDGRFSDVENIRKNVFDSIKNTGF